MKLIIGLIKEEDTDLAEPLLSNTSIRYGKRPRESSPKVLLPTKKKCLIKAEDFTLYPELPWA
jgi:hypothetical protein